MLRFIHTADWHLGNKMHEVERKAENEAFLKWLAKEIQEKKIQALVISGDVFDTSKPSNEAEGEYYRFLASLLNTGCRNIIVVGGNHDSAAKLETSKELLEALNIHVVGSIDGLKPEEMVFELKDEENQVCGICAAVPYARENELQKYFDGKCNDGEFSDKAYKALYEAVYAEADKLRAGRKIPIIATGHLYAADLEGKPTGKQTGEETDDGVRTLDVVGNLGSVHSGIFPEGFDYVALGHIHYKTSVGGNKKIMYSGSPFVMGFDEAGFDHHVLQVELDEELKVTPLVVPSSVVYKRITGDCEYIKSALTEYLKEDSPKPVYLELYYKKETGVDIRLETEEIINKLPKKNVQVVSWRIQDAKKILAGSENFSGMSEFKNYSEEEIFKSLILSKISADENAEEIFKEYLPLFKEIAEEVRNEN